MHLQKTKPKKARCVGDPALAPFPQKESGRALALQLPFE